MEEQKNLVLVKKDGKTKIVKYEKEIIDKIKESPTHKCMDCKNMDKCPKIFDEKKKTINKYPFITEGIQVINSEKEIEHFVVKNCKCFIKDINNNNNKISKTPATKMRIIRKYSLNKLKNIFQFFIICFFNK